MTSLVRFDSIAGVSIHWIRWGRTGERRIAPAFLAAVEGALAHAWALSEWDIPVGVLCAGAYVDKPGYHRRGLALDIVGFQWEDGTTWTLPLKPDGDWAGAFAIEAVMRMHLPQVLGPSYDDRHADHWHVDARGAAAGFSHRSRADVAFLQAALHANGWMPYDITIDGRWGSYTARAVGRFLGEPLELSPRQVRKRWPIILRQIADYGFAKAAGPSF